MTEISHFLEPGGWRVTRTASGCATMFPKSGRILIGRGEAEGECRLVWLDGSQCLRIVEGLQRQKGSSEWKGTFTREGQQYWITVKATAVKARMGKARRKRIEGSIWALDEKERASEEPPTEYAPTGTWGAEAGGGGGGGGGNVPPPPPKSKANGSDASAH